jgi:hypothetical protein
MDSFELGERLQVDPARMVRVECVDVLRQLGAAPGQYVVQIVSEWCDEGTLHGAIRRGVFRPSGVRSKTWALRALLRTAREVGLGEGGGGAGEGASGVAGGRGMGASEQATWVGIEGGAWRCG